MDENRPNLQKVLKPHWVWAIALGSSIGWGAFVQPANWLEMAGPLGVMIGFTIGACLMMIIAVSYGFLIKEFPVSGGEFAYTFIGLGRTHAFIAGWFLTLGYICIVALNASALSLMIKFVYPTFVERLPLYEIANWNVYVPEILIAIVSLSIFAYYNIKGMQFTGRLQFIFCVVMIVSILALTFLVGFSPVTEFDNLKPFFSPQQVTLASILSIVAIAPWAYVGFDNVPQVAEEFNFSSKKAFGLIIMALLASALLYNLMIYITAMAQPWLNLVEQQYEWGTAVAVQSVLGNFGIVLLVSALCMGIFTGLNGFIISASRLLYSMSRAKILPRAFSILHPKFNTPYISILITVGIAMISPWFGREVLLWVVDMSSIGVSIAYFYTCYTAFKLFGWSAKAGKRKVIVISPIKKSIALLGTLLSLFFIALLLVPVSPAFLGIESRIALFAWTVIGLLFYIFKRKEYNEIPEEELSYLILGDKYDQIKKLS